MIDCSLSLGVAADRNDVARRAVVVEHRRAPLRPAGRRCRDDIVAALGEPVPLGADPVPAGAALPRAASETEAGRCCYLDVGEADRRPGREPGSLSENLRLCATDRKRMGTGA